MNRPSFLLIGGLLLLAAFVAFSALFTVHQTQQALILQFGNPVRVEREPGLKVKVPFIQNVEFFERRILDLDPPVQEVLLSDQKRINVDAFARYRIVDPLEFKKRAVTVTNFQQIFGGRMNSIIRTEVARVSLADMLSQNRAVIMGKIADELRRQAPDFGVEVIDVRLGRTDLPDATSQAVYNRMRSARVAQAAQLRAQGEELKATIQAEADRERTIIIAEATRQSQTLRGEGDALRTRALNDAYGQDVEFFDFFRSLEAYAALGGEGRTMVLTPDSDFFRFFRQENGQTSGEATP
ncbi:MAG TPA: protease modulator HflC [Rhodospirillales bacterium]|jgi:membrane protease subunit HflC|nr:protease modulator HflC [Rhodospirillales bacterium]